MHVLHSSQITLFVLAFYRRTTFDMHLDRYLCLDIISYASSKAKMNNNLGRREYSKGTAPHVTGIVMFPSWPKIMNLIFHGPLFT
jgi:hypothetical protein